LVYITFFFFSPHQKTQRFYDDDFYGVKPVDAAIIKKSKVTSNLALMISVFVVIRNFWVTVTALVQIN